MAKATERQTESRMIRGTLLQILHAQVMRERGDEEGLSTYLHEDVIYLKIARRFPQTREMMRGHLYYLRDRNYVKFRDLNIDGKKSLMWRITADGIDVIDGSREDRGIYVE